jgi:transaldolase
MVSSFSFLKKFRIAIYADGADFKSIVNLNKKNYIKGFTTNPTLMRKSGVLNYKNFCINLVKKIKKKPISFEVFSDSPEEIKLQVKKISNFGKNVYVKIPIQNTKGVDMSELIIDLNKQNIKINVTAVFTFDQVKKLIEKISNNTEIIISVFAGRIADTGVDPEITVKKIIQYSKIKKNIKILWASSREIFNLYQAANCGCHIITLSEDLIQKLIYFKKDLKIFSKETALMFYNDAKKSGFQI